MLLLHYACLTQAHLVSAARRLWICDRSKPLHGACRLLSPSRIYKQIFDPIESKTELAAACQSLLSSQPRLSYQAAVRQLAQGVAVLPQQTDEGSGALPMGDGDNQELHQFQEHNLLEHAAFVVQQLAPIFGRHAYRVCCPVAFVRTCLQGTLPCCMCMNMLTQYVALLHVCEHAYRVCCPVAFVSEYAGQAQSRRPS